MGPKAFRDSKKRLTTRFGKIAYADQDTDEGLGVPILFLHGVPLNSAHWRGVIARLRSRHRCLAPDLMGLGDTEVHNPAALAFPQQAEMALDLLNELGVERFHLVGNDSGGAIAQIIACSAPQRVMSLTLTNCDVDTNVPPRAFAKTHRLAKIGLFAMGLLFMRTDSRLERSDLGVGVAFENVANITPELVSVYLDPLLSSHARRRQLNRYVASIDKKHTIAIRDALAALETPTQILWATGDVFFSMRDAEWLAGTIPGFRRLLRAEGARLFFCEERPDWVAAKIEEFIASEAVE